MLLLLARKPTLTEWSFNDQWKFERVTLENDAFLNFVMNQEKPIDTTFKNFIDSKSMSKEIFMYGLCKGHKQEVDGCPPPPYFYQFYWSWQQDPALPMCCLDIDSLFINIPLDETIDICINELFEYTDRVEGFTKSDLKQLLCLATKEPYFKFIDLLCKQTDGVAMVSPLGTSLANAFL